MKLDGDNPYVDLKLHVRWQSEGMRLRLRMDTTLASCLARCEVPFGVAERAPYAGRETAKGEWAAHRFAALEDDGTHEGIALMNQGCPGVEPGYRCLTTTLLRSPRRQVAGMAPDDTARSMESMILHSVSISIMADGSPAMRCPWRSSSMRRYGCCLEDMQIACRPAMG